MTQISIRLENEVKTQAENVCQELGLSLSAAINIFLKKLGREKRIPFDVSVSDPFYSEENMKRLKASIEQMEKTGGTVHEV